MPPWLGALAPLIAQLPAAGTVAERLNALHALAATELPLPRFVPADSLPRGVAYERFIDDTAEVPTRDNAHDLLNGLVWLAHPALKWRLNRLQAAAIARDGVGGRRGALRDALTLFDENGALWPRPHPDLRDAWMRRDWVGLLVDRRALWHERQPVIVGHALLEQMLLAPRRALTAHVLLQPQPLAMAEADWAAKPFVPLPLAGVPGWWPGQEDPDFYRDSKVFRPARNLKSHPAP